MSITKNSRLKVATISKKAPIKTWFCRWLPQILALFKSGLHFPRVFTTSSSMRQATEVAQACLLNVDGEVFASPSRMKSEEEKSRDGPVYRERCRVFGESEATVQQQEEECSFVSSKCQKRTLCGWNEGWGNTTWTERPFPFISGESRFTLSACDRWEILKIV